MRHGGSGIVEMDLGVVSGMEVGVVVVVVVVDVLRLEGLSKNVFKISSPLSDCFALKLET